MQRARKSPCRRQMHQEVRYSSFERPHHVHCQLSRRVKRVRTTASAGKAMPRTALLYLAVLLLPVVAGVSLGEVPLSIAVPDLALKLIVIDEDIDMQAFDAALTTIIESHLDAFMFLSRQLPPSGAAVYTKAFVGVALNSTVKRTLLGKQGDQETLLPVSLVQSDFTGNAAFSFATNDEKAAASSQSSELLVLTKDSAIECFRGAQYDRLVQRLAEHPLLSLVAKIQVLVEDELIAEGDVADTMDSDNESLSVVAIVAILLLCLMAVAAVMLIIVMRKLKSEAQRNSRKKWRRPRPENSDSDYSWEKDQWHPSEREESGDAWMDEMTKKITSIPIRTVSKPKSSLKKKPMTPRPAARERQSTELACIDEDESGMDDSSVNMDFREIMEVDDVELDERQDFEPATVNSSCII